MSRIRNLYGAVAIATALALGGGGVAVVSVIDAPPAAAWQPLSLSVQGHGCESATVRGSNPEGQPGTVRGGNLWSNGTTIPAHGSITKTVTHSGTYTVVVNYPSDQTLRSASVTVHIPACPPPPTTTTTAPPTTTTTAPPPPTTAPPTTAPPSTPPPSVDQPKNTCDDVTYTAAPVVCTATPAFTG